jgi:hypothetical protein
VQNFALFGLESVVEPSLAICVERGYELVFLEARLESPQLFSAHFSDSGLIVGTRPW